MRKVRRQHTTQTVPWCKCGYKRPMGYVQHPDHPEEYYVHSGCMKPSKVYWESRASR